MTAIPDHISLDSGKNPTYSMIWLHGLGADGSDFVPIAGELDLPIAMRYLFPHALQRPVTINGGYLMRAWYDIASPHLATGQDEAGIRASQQQIEQLIAQEKARGIPARHIYLAGFSQGGAIALHTALRQSQALGGVLALSTYLPLANTAAQEIAPEARTTPVFMAHGKDDDIVPAALGQSSRDALEQLGFRVDWHEYGMAHSVCDQELGDIRQWLLQQLTRTQLPGE
jgi:phospholipase/carboxylesterase